MLFDVSRRREGFAADVFYEVHGGGSSPCIVLHGGPGSGLNRQHLRYFDPSYHTVILFDQRGCGKSRSTKVWEANNTTALLDDINTILKLERVSRPIVVGGSWGGTLAMAYASAFPENCRALVVRSAMYSVSAQLQWMMIDRPKVCRAAKRAVRDLLATVERNEQVNPARALFDCITLSDDKREVEKIARSVSGMELPFHGVVPDECIETDRKVDSQEIRRARIYLWYWMNNFHLEQDSPISQTDLARVQHLLIHGDLDLICPIDQAQAFARKDDRINLQVVEEAGHNALANKMVSAMQRAILSFTNV